MITFTDNSKKNIVPHTIFGTICVLFGVSIYYFLPLSLLKQDYGMILGIFFLILIGMLFGLTVFATNLQGILERLLVYVFFFWEKKSMRALLRKNLAAHKQTNFLTSIIYALTLGCIIFLLVTASLEVESISSAKTLTSCDIMLDSNMKINATLTDPILRLYKDQIKDFGYETNNINDYQSE